MSALSDPPTMAFLCRVDLQLSPGKLAVQCAHAAVGSLKQQRRHIHEWFNVGPNRPHAKSVLQLRMKMNWNTICNSSRSISSIRSHQRCWINRGCTRNNHCPWCWTRPETYNGFSFQESESIRMRSYDGFSKFSSSIDCSQVSADMSIEINHSRWSSSSIMN